MGGIVECLVFGGFFTIVTVLCYQGKFDSSSLFSWNLVKTHFPVFKIKGSKLTTAQHLQNPVIGKDVNGAWFIFEVENSSQFKQGFLSSGHITTTDLSGGGATGHGPRCDFVVNDFLKNCGKIHITCSLPF